MKINIHPYLSKPITLWGTAFLLESFCFYYMGGYHFCYMEQWGTFIHDTAYMTDTLMQPGGFIQLVADFLIQFFISPWSGILITSALLSTIFVLTTGLLRRWIGNNHLFPCAALPVISLTYLHYNANYLYGGSIAFLFLLFALTLHLRIRSTFRRFGYSLFCSLFLFLLAGSIASLYVCLVLLWECTHSPKRVFLFFALPATVFLMGWLSLRTGWYGEWKHVLLPDGYFTLRLQAASSIYLPWGMTLAVFTIGSLYKFIRLQKSWIIHSLLIIQCLFIGYFLWQNTPKYIQKDTEVFKEMSYLARHRQWDALIARSRELPMTNLLHQNYLNLALAEKGLLTENLSRYPNIGIQSLFIGANKTPYISAMLSDIYYAMGHIAFSQRYAFEANESLGNRSPYLLQRLVQVSLLFGYDELALKYIRILGKTLYYKEWAERHRAFVGNPSLLKNDPLLGAKQKCIFPDNRFSGSKGLDKDLEEIIKSNPGHQATVQYLEAIRTYIGNK